MNITHDTLYSDMDLPKGFGEILEQHPEALKNFSSMPKERQQKIITQTKLMKDKDEMSQLIDRIASHSFQG